MAREGGGAMAMDAFLTPDDRSTLLERLAGWIGDYRAGEIERPDAGHVARWVGQFDPAERDAVLAETAYALGQFYYPRRAVEGWLDRLIDDPGFAGADPSNFWRSVGFLKLQRRSRSQHQMLELLNQCLRRRLGFEAGRSAPANGVFLYLDDGIFSGNQVRWDLRNWMLTGGMRGVTVRIVAVGVHRSGHQWADQGIASLARDRQIRVEWWSLREIEDRRSHLSRSEVLRPTFLPDDEYVASWRAHFEKRGGRFVPRPAGGPERVGPFSSEAGRQMLEQAFLRKGAFIFALPQSPDPDMRPLGYSRFASVGFGTLFTTWRNCPNNAPLVLWWGDPFQGHPLDLWYPLLPRRIRGV
jgi:hypothetical protein